MIHEPQVTCAPGAHVDSETASTRLMGEDVIGTDTAQGVADDADLT